MTDAGSTELPETFPPMRVRPASEADAEPLAVVHVASWQEAYAGLMPAPLLASLSVTERAQRWRSILSQPDMPGRSAVFVAEQSGQIVGFGSCGAQRTQALRDQGYTAEITALYVLQAAQGRGTGSALMKAMAEFLTSGGRQAAGLWVIERNERARRFYERLGGEVIGREQDRRDDLALDEVAYGWRDMQRLLQPSLR